MKTYSGKVYSLNGTFKFTINPRDVKSDIYFTSSLNGGQGQLSITFKKPIEYTDIENTDIIKVYQIDVDNPDGRLIYTGIVQDVIRNMTAKYEEITLPLLGLGSIFTYKTFNGNKTADPGTIIGDFVDLINIDYNLFTKNIDTYGTSVNIDFEYKKLNKSMQQIQELTDMNYVVKPSGEISFKSKPATATHILTIGKEVQEIKIDEDTEKLVNTLIFEWSGGTTIYSDATSKTNYGLREIYITDTNIKDQTSADEFGGNYIAKYKNPILKTQLKVNLNYDIESINVGDTITIKQLDFSIVNKLIVKMQYYKDLLIIDLEDFESFGSKFL